jgi:hypothetical protein
MDFVTHEPRENIPATERPILFSTEMVNAILEGRKTVTRRVVHTDHVKHWFNYIEFIEDDSCTKNWEACSVSEQEIFNSTKVMNRYGAVGDTLWVRETFAIVPSSAYRQSPDVVMTTNPNDKYECAVYKAGWERSAPTWRPSIYMPRWASRISLRLTGLKAERLWSITEGSALDEGVTVKPEQSARAAYFELWDRINGKGLNPVAKNPWVWVIGFEVLESK